MSDQRDRALQRARRRLRWLEIETHRIKAELARLEAAFEDDLADRLSDKYRRLALTTRTAAVRPKPSSAVDREFRGCLHSAG